MKEVKDSEEIKKIMKSKKPKVVFFYAAWCPHCQVMHKPFEEMEKESNGKEEYYKMESEDIPDDLGIGGYPHFVLVKDGGVKKVADGEMPKEELKKKLTGGCFGACSAGSRRRRRTRRFRNTRRKTFH